MTTLTTITPGAKERISANAGRIYATKALGVAQPKIEECIEIAIAIENRVTALCRPEPKAAP